MDPEFARRILGWKHSRGGLLVANIADSASETSRSISSHMLAVLGVAEGLATGAPDTASGRPLETEVALDLGRDLASRDSSRAMQVLDTPGDVSNYVQYSHLKRVDELSKASPELRITLGTDYLIKPDVVVVLPGREGELPFLHAVISCKWTIRSDRVQNIRHEYNLLVRHRRERLPHLVTVTAEPMPTRLAAIARGTGEVDATYHVAFHALDDSLRHLSANGTLPLEQLDAWNEVVGQGRVRPYSELAATLLRW